MNLTAYISGLRAQAQRLGAQIDALNRPGIRMQSRWGREPFRDITPGWRKELERRLREISHISDALERGHPV